MRNSLTIRELSIWFFYLIENMLSYKKKNKNTWHGANRVVYWGMNKQLLYLIIRAKALIKLKEKLQEKNKNNWSFPLTYTLAYRIVTYGKRPPYKAH